LQLLVPRPESAAALHHLRRKDSSPATRVESPFYVAAMRHSAWQTLLMVLCWNAVFNGS
jgi:hypothetical protein